MYRIKANEVKVTDTKNLDKVLSEMNPATPVVSVVDITAVAGANGLLTLTLHMSDSTTKDVPVTIDITP